MTSRLLFFVALCWTCCAFGIHARFTETENTPVVPSLLTGMGGAGHTKINGELRVLGKTTVSILRTAKLAVIGNMEVHGTLTTSDVSTKTLSAESVTAGVIASPTGTIVIEGGLSIVNAFQAANAQQPPPNSLPNSAPSGTTSFVELQAEASEPVMAAHSVAAESLVLGGVKQWQLVFHEDFDEPGTAGGGWSVSKTSNCGSPDFFLGGFCVLGAGETTKTFKGLPAHEQVRVTARIHFIDRWSGETAYCKVDDSYVWLDSLSSGRSSKRGHASGINVCGSSHPERRLSVPIDISLRHAASSLTVTFGSSFNQDDATANNPCQRSIGVDDVMIYVK